MFEGFPRSWRTQIIQRAAYCFGNYFFACHEWFSHSALELSQGDVKLGFRTHTPKRTEDGTFAYAAPTWVSLSVGATALRPLASALGAPLNAALIEGYDGLTANGRRAVDAAMEEASAGARDPLPAPYPGPCRCKSCAALADKTKGSAPTEGNDDESETASAILSPVGGKAASPKKKPSSSPSKPAVADAAPTAKEESRPAKKAVSCKHTVMRHVCRDRNWIGRDYVIVFVFIHH